MDSHISYIVKEQKIIGSKIQRKKKNVLMKKGGLSTLEIYKKESPRGNNWLIIRTIRLRLAGMFLI